jgi:hypothetical protein
VPDRTAPFLPRRDGVARIKARKTQRGCKQMDAEHADGPEAGMDLHGNHRPAGPDGAAPAPWSLSHPRVQRPSACICVKPCLLHREPHLARGEPGSRAHRQNPMHQFRPSTPPRTTPEHVSAGNTRSTIKAHRHGAPPAFEHPIASQNPMHQFTRPPPLPRPSGPEADTVDVLPEPHAPIQAVSSARQQPGRQHPMSSGQLPDRPGPPSRPECS